MWYISSTTGHVCLQAAVHYCVCVCVCVCRQQYICVCVCVCVCCSVLQRGSHAFPRPQRPSPGLVLHSNVALSIMEIHNCSFSPNRSQTNIKKTLPNAKIAKAMAVSHCAVISQRQCLCNTTKKYMHTTYPSTHTNHKLYESVDTIMSK